MANLKILEDGAQRVIEETEKTLLDRADGFIEEIRTTMAERITEMRTAYSIARTLSPDLLNTIAGASIASVSEFEIPDPKSYGGPPDGRVGIRCTLETNGLMNRVDLLASAGTWNQMPLLGKGKHRVILLILPLAEEKPA